MYYLSFIDLFSTSLSLNISYPFFVFIYVWAYIDYLCIQIQAMLSSILTFKLANYCVFFSAPH